MELIKGIAFNHFKCLKAICSLHERLASSLSPNVGTVAFLMHGTSLVDDITLNFLLSTCELVNLRLAECESVSSRLAMLSCLGQSMCNLKLRNSLMDGKSN